MSIHTITSHVSRISGLRQAYAVREIGERDIVEVSDEYEGSPRRWFRRSRLEARREWRRRLAKGWVTV